MRPMLNTAANSESSRPRRANTFALRENSNVSYSTRNIQLACFVLARGAGVPTIKGQRGRAEFIFDDPEEKLGWEEQEFSADTPVGPRQLFWAIKELRAQMDRVFGKPERIISR